VQAVRSPRRVFDEPPPQTNAHLQERVSNARGFVFLRTRPTSGRFETRPYECLRSARYPDLASFRTVSVEDIGVAFVEFFVLSLAREFALILWQQ